MAPALSRHLARGNPGRGTRPGSPLQPDRGDRAGVRCWLATDAAPQAATVLLRDVLGFGTEEVAAMLKASQTAIKGTLQRGRAALQGSRSNTDRPPPPKSAEERDLARRFAEAYVAADIDGLLRLLTDDAWLSMPPAPHEYRGPDAIRSFLQASLDFRGERGVHLIPGRANNQPSFASYLSDQQKGIARQAGLFVLTLTDRHIKAITRFHRDDLYPLLGFPASLCVPAAGE